MPLPTSLCRSRTDTPAHSTCYPPGEPTHGLNKRGNSNVYGFALLYTYEAHVDLGPRGEYLTIFDSAGHLPYQERLEPLYGAVPHRISHFSALAMAPVAVKVGLALDVSGPPVDRSTAAKLAVIPREESHDTCL